MYEERERKREKGGEQSRKVSLLKKENNKEEQLETWCWQFGKADASQVPLLNTTSKEAI